MNPRGPIIQLSFPVLRSWQLVLWIIIHSYSFTTEIFSSTITMKMVCCNNKFPVNFYCESAERFKQKVKLRIAVMRKNLSLLEYHVKRTYVLTEIDDDWTLGNWFNPCQKTACQATRDIFCQRRLTEWRLFKVFLINRVSGGWEGCVYVCRLTCWLMQVQPCKQVPHLERTYTCRNRLSNEPRKHDPRRLGIAIAR